MLKSAEVDKQEVLPIAPPPIAQLEERETVDVADISMSPVRSRVGGLFMPGRLCTSGTVCTVYRVLSQSAHI